MAWSYDEGNLNTTDATGRLNSTRLLIGDTDTNDKQVQDEEVSFALAQSNNNVYKAGSWLCRSIAAKYSRKVNTELSGALSADYSDLSRHYLSLADVLDYQGKTSGASVGAVAGGITKSTVEAVRQNTNRIEGSFRRDRFTNPPSYQSPEYE
tara:strand:- start:108 stop:563 length:456 start_codon:yes stop_codon:yes gene_type:complete